VAFFSGAVLLLLPLPLPLPIRVHLPAPVTLSLVVLAVRTSSAFVGILLIRLVVAGFDLVAHGR